MSSEEKCINWIEEHIDTDVCFNLRDIKVSNFKTEDDGTYSFVSSFIERNVHSCKYIEEIYERLYGLMQDQNMTCGIPKAIWKSMQNAG